MPKKAEAKTVETENIELGVANMWGVFDEDDLCDDAPTPIATFQTEGEANGFVALCCQGGCMTPVVRPCVIAGTVNIEKN